MTADTWEDIGPATAMRYLETIDYSETLASGDERTVAHYAAQMKAGLWAITEHGISFDADGRLIDGQRRLWAIAESGATVRMRVFRNVTIARG